jgi:hypothetical protein
VKSYIFGLALKILLLAAFVVGAFVLLAFFGQKIFGGGEPPAAAASPKDVLLVLMENYEKILLANRTGLEKERSDYLAQLNAAAGRTERAKIEAQLKELEKKNADNAVRLQGVTAEKKDLETREKAKTDLIASLTAEKQKAEESLLDLKVNWSGYAERLENEFLTRAGTEDEKDTIRRAFAADNGLAFISAVAERYSGSGAETETPKTTPAAASSSPSPTTAASAQPSASPNGAAEQRLKDLEEKVKALSATVDKNEGDMRDLQTQIAVLLDVGNINGFFISRNNAVYLLTNRKKQAEILSTGTFPVFDNNKNQVSKIYVARKGDRIDYTKLPGYPSPKPGNWF